MAFDASVAIPLPHWFGFSLYFNNEMRVPYRIGDQRFICYDRTGEILIRRDNP